MTPAQVGRLLVKASAKNSKTAFLTAYSKNFAQISKSFSDYDGIKTNLKVKNIDEALDAIRVSSVLNDLTFVDLPPNGQAQIRIPGPGMPLETFLGGTESITINTDDRSQILDESGNIKVIPALTIATDATTKAIMAKIAPLTMRGRAIVLPSRGLIKRTGILPNGGNHWHLQDISPNSPFDAWNVSYTQETPSSNTFEGAATEGEVTLSEIALPFLSGISFYDLARVLEDENDHISKARVALKTVLQNAKDQKTDLPMIVNDVVRPQLEALTRRFDVVARSNSLRQQGVIVGSCALVLGGILTGGWIAVGAVLGGVGGAGLLYKQQADFLEKKADLEEDPLYLIWRLNKIRQN